MLISTDFYRFLQLRSYLMSHKEWSHLKLQITDIERFFIKVAKKEKCDKIVSYLYKCLQLNMSGSDPGIKEKWELEMNIIFEDQIWEQICESGHKLTSSPTWKEFNWKLNVRYFKTPFIISKFDKTKTNLCWRQCGHIGDHTHVFWDCPKLKFYWEGVRSELAHIFQIYIPWDPLIFVFGALPLNFLNKDEMYLLKVLVLVAKKMITISWYNPLPPTISQWKERIRQVYIMEKITAKLNLTLDLFMKRWNPVITYMDSSL